MTSECAGGIMVIKNGYGKRKLAGKVQILAKGVAFLLCQCH